MPDELSLQYQELMQRLRAPFPSESIMHRKGGKGSYIPTDAYVQRLEEEAGRHWSWSIKQGPIFLENDNILMIGTLTILGATRDGSGTAIAIKKDNKYTNLNYTIRAAAQDALRDACDQFMIGWSNLKKGKDNLSQTKEEKVEVPADKRCAKCGEIVNPEQLNWLMERNIKLFFCEQHVPKHFSK
ncbi:Rad52/Rad22 family DNA repair protein [Alkalihalobacillus oceani]|uniref:Rad52/Rad22 family DNA repair protein n=1 Tax=Halalkalibacter oceani TaxID=1653776 RepID=A0A9X2DWA3_9BACI|nr:Rad52/Rad22 family DNA repair protein [Halalkalibacter oceani]MCM3716590.1 Rad52/Rad22 family DNA repair protein [Halalkalibacter oceani]